ncbi:MAG TPA: dephospho-CoA kinase [Cyclobacteriaceae bacterium]|nr:dephospho-CoA kinase [Cyclobacteriaceae bacterium]
MKTPLQIGITGGIGSGKSLAGRIFNLLGVPVYDADSRAKSIMTTDGILVSQIRKEFGVLSFRADGSVNREYLAAHVFNDPEKLKRLNGLVHPRVGEDFKQWVNGQRTPYVLKEAALLFETGSNTALHKIIVVSAPEQLRISRVLQRDKHRTEQQVKDIMSNQLKEEEKLKRADYILVNDGHEPLIPQVLALHKQILLMAQ